MSPRFRPATAQLTPLAMLLCACALSACTLEGLPTPGGKSRGPGIDQAGTCFAIVTKAEDGSYTLASGVGDGTLQPKAVPSTKLSAKQVDDAMAKEREIMKINPECLATYTVDRATADPKSVVPPEAATGSATEAKTAANAKS